MKGHILITGAPSNVGSAVVSELISQRGAFRVAAHDPGEARRVFGTAIPVVPFDFRDPSTFAEAFTGVSSVLLVRPPALSDAKHDIAPALVAARSVGVRRVVFVSLQGLERLRFTPHFGIESMIRENGFDHVFLRCGFFMQNLCTTHRDEIRHRSEINVPVGRAKTAFVDVRDVAAVAARCLTAPAGVGDAAYTLTGGEALDYYEVAAVLSSVLDRPIRYANPSVFRFLCQQVAAGQPLGFAAVAAGLYTLTRFGMAEETTGTVRDILGREPTPFARFAQDYKHLWTTPIQNP